MDKKANESIVPHSKLELSIGDYFNLSLEGTEEFLNRKMTQLLDHVVLMGVPAYSITKTKK